MSTRDIQETIYQMFYCDLDKDTISRITDKIIPEKIREDSVYKEKSVYLIIGVNTKVKKDFGLLDSWIRIF